LNSGSGTRAFILRSSAEQLDAATIIFPAPIPKSGSRFTGRAFISWLYSFALSLGGPGLFTVAFLDSSFISLPQINDILVVLMVTEHKTRMDYFEIMYTRGV